MVLSHCQCYFENTGLVMLAEAGLETTHTYQVASEQVHPDAQRGAGG